MLFVIDEQQIDPHSGKPGRLAMVWKGPPLMVRPLAIMSQAEWGNVRRFVKRELGEIDKIRGENQFPKNIFRSTERVW